MFTWKALRDQLAASPWLEPTDDLTTQRGIVAAATAVLDRMSNSERLREVSWRPIRYSAPASAAKTPQSPPMGGGNPSAKVTNSIPAPRAPSPAPAYAEISF